MRKLFLSSLILLPVLCAQGASREYLFDCAHTDVNSAVERLNIYETTKGVNVYHEVDVVAFENGVEKIDTKKVFLKSKYKGAILEFNGGNFRVKIDRVRANNGYLWAFARVPDYDIHSFDWKCKEI